MPTHLIYDGPRIKLKGFEPSGLSYHANSGQVLVVDDEGAVAGFDPNEPNHIVRYELNDELDGRDLEGICALPGGDVLLLDEKRRSLWRVQLEGHQVRIIGEHRLPKGVLRGGKKAGLEGITARADGTLWVCDQRSSALLELTLGSDGVTLRTLGTLPCRDPSGLHNDGDALWVVSGSDDRLLIFEDPRDLDRPDHAYDLAAGGAVEGVTADGSGRIWLAFDADGNRCVRAARR